MRLTLIKFHELNLQRSQPFDEHLLKHVLMGVLDESTIGRHHHIDDIMCFYLHKKMNSEMPSKILPIWHHVLQIKKTISQILLKYFDEV